MIYLYQALFVAVFSYIGYNHPPFPDTTPWHGAIIGFSFSLFLVVLALRIRNTELKNIWAGALGLAAGVIMGWLMFQVFNLITMSFSAYIFFKALFLLAIPLTGMFIGLLKPSLFSPLNIREFFRGSSAFTDSFLLDTSALIDGRIAAIAETGFIDGELIITPFILAELQNIADSGEATKRIKGRRGLDVIDQLRKNKEISVTILNKTMPGVREVDHKLINLAKEHNFKIITNDVNLSKIAKLQDVRILNVNELAFAMKPVVYPGEKLNVIIQKEGKEKKQGLAYLEDGTMIVVEEAKNEIGNELEVEVTSVLQSTTGKMIFARKSQ